MKGVDYSKTLSKEREYFKDTIRKTNESADKRVANANERNEVVVKKQAKNFIEDKAELESSYQKNIERLEDKSRSSVNTDNARFHEERDKERQDFSNQSISKRKDFDQRLSDITNSYKKAAATDKIATTEMQSIQKRKYDKNILDTESHADNQLKTYRDEITGQGVDLKDRYNRERQQLVRSHEDQTNETQKEAAFKRAELKSHLRDDFKKSREVQDAEFEQQKQYTVDRMNTMKDKYETRASNMTKDYSRRSDKLVEVQQREAVLANRENQNNLADVRRDFNKQLRLIDLDKRRRDNGSGEFADVMDRQKGLRDSSANDSRYNELKDQMVAKENKYQEQTIKDKDQFAETLKGESADATARLDRKLNDASIDKIVTVSKEREKAEAQVNNRETQNRLERQAFEQRISVDRNNANDRLNNLKQNFNTSISRLEEDHQVKLDDVTLVSNKDKAAFVKNVTESRNKEMFEMKREFAHLMDQAVQDFEQRLGIYKRDNEYLKMTMDQKVKNIIDQSDKKLESQTTLYEERISADHKNAMTLADQKEHNWKNTMYQTTTNFSKRIDKMQIDNDTTLKFLTNDYETKLKELKSTTNKEMAQKDSNKQIELQNIKTTYETDKQHLISFYETKINDLKTSFQEQIDSKKEYKSIS
jgi:hypothetical protein